MARLAPLEEIVTEEELSDEHGHARTLARRLVPREAYWRGMPPEGNPEIEYDLELVRVVKRLTARASECSHQLVVEDKVISPAHTEVVWRLAHDIIAACELLKPDLVKQGKQPANWTKVKS